MITLLLKPDCCQWNVAPPQRASETAGCSKKAVKKNWGIFTLVVSSLKEEQSWTAFLVSLNFSPSIFLCFFYLFFVCFFLSLSRSLSFSLPFLSIFLSLFLFFSIFFCQFLSLSPSLVFLAFICSALPFSSEGPRTLRIHQVDLNGCAGHRPHYPPINRQYIKMY